MALSQMLLNRPTPWLWQLDDAVNVTASFLWNMMFKLDSDEPKNLRKL
jgi:hypothetical protein